MGPETGRGRQPERGETPWEGATDGAACKGGRKGLGARGHARRPSELAPIGGVAVLPIVTHTPPNPPMAFRRAPLYGDTNNHLPQQQAAARARRAKPGANAPASLSEAQGAPGRTTGGGGRGGVNEPYPTTHPRPDPPTPAAARAVRRRPVNSPGSSALPSSPSRRARDSREARQD